MTERHATGREELLDALRPTAFAIAYRMLGSVSEAEDVVQEALLRVHQSLDAGEEIASPRAFVATITTRLAINELKSARARRERYVGEWLPEPIITDGSGAPDDPARHAETADSLSLAMLVLLESLSPEQRAVLLLHDVFGYGYPEITDIVGKTEDNVRQLASRARQHVKARRPRFTTTREQQRELASRFFAAAHDGDLAALESLLAHDVELTGDGGGKVPALARSLRGRSRVAHTLANWLRALARFPQVSMRPVEINGGPGAIYVDDHDRVLGVWSLDIADGEITGIRSIVNPDKLAHLGEVGDVVAIIQSARGPEPRVCRVVTTRGMAGGSPPGIPLPGGWRVASVSVGTRRTPGQDSQPTPSPWRPRLFLDTGHASHPAGSGEVWSGVMVGAGRRP